MFYRIETDGTRQPLSLPGFYAGPVPTPCWMIGGGPSLRDLPMSAVTASPIPKFAINLAGSGLVRPTFWTSYDPTARFHRSTYLDPSVIKFVHSCRAMDLIPESTYKVCDAPATLFFDRDRNRGFHDFPLSLGSVTDWQDSLIQAVDIAYKLGFRELILAGCEMFISPAPELQIQAAAHGVNYTPGQLLKDFIRECEQAGLAREELESLSTGPQYHFDESKPLAAAISTDFHYFRVAQYLRLSSRSLALAGLKLTSVTPQSRLNDILPYEPINSVLDRIHTLIGNPQTESTAGRYTRNDPRRPSDLGPMRDFRPHFWPPKTNPQQRQQAPQAPSAKERARQALENMPEVEVPINEEG